MSEITLGIIGGGQLGSMLAIAAKKLNVKTVIFCDDADAPAQNFCNKFIAGSYDNNEKISFQALYGEERLDKKDGFNVGAVYSTLTYDEVEADIDEGIEAKSGGTGTVMGGFAGFAGFGAKVGLEYHMGTDLDNEYKKNNDDKIPYGSSSTLMSVYANYSLSFIDGLSLFGRYDMVDLGNTNDANTPENESDEDNVSTMMAGVIYNCTDGLTFSPHIVQTTEGTGDPMMDFKVLFQLKF